MFRKSLLIVACLAGVMGLLSPIEAQKAKIEPLKLTAKATAPDASGKQTINLTINIDKAWHIYANPVKNEDLQGAATVIKVTSQDGKELTAQVQYPAGAKHTEKGIGDYQVYEDQVTIPIVVQRNATDGTLEVNVSYQACDAKKCLPPQDAKVKVR